MAIDILPIHDILGYKFEIPNYQRGYRWEDEQILAVLNDLKDFVKNSSKGDFYCLQPVVTVKVSDKEYIVVDGQQRLTTLYLILHRLGIPDSDKFTLHLPKRDKQDFFLNQHLFASKEDASFEKNIDNFYLRKAYDVIDDWISDPANEEEVYTIKFILTKKKDESKFGYAAVIWHVIEKKDAMEAFRRLNYGKIPLKASDLVKAVLLQTDCYTKDEKIMQDAIAQRRAMEWDEMEFRLANPLFHSMLSNSSKNKNEEPIKGIDLILEFVADQINNTLNSKVIRKKRNGSEDFYIFNVIDRKIKEDAEAKIPRKNSIDFIWGEIEKTFNMLCDWYENREWYHYIGLLRILRNSTTSSNFIRDIYKLAFEETKSPYDNSKNILRPVSRPGFSNKLRKEVGKEIKVPLAKKINDENKEEILPDNMQGLRSPELHFEKSQKKKMIDILAALNVLTVLAESDGLSRFPFHQFQKYNPTSLEHIHPQNISENISYDDLKKWLDERSEDLKLDDKDATTDYNDTKKEGEQEKQNLISLKNDIVSLNKLLKTKDIFESNHEKAMDLAKRIDKNFGDMAGISDDEKHTIANMALVSKDVNSALGNRHLDRKREILQKYASLPPSDPQATFIPPCTLKVFSKHYRPGNPGNMKFWQPEDRTKYFEIIEKVYNFFTYEKSEKIPNL